MLVKAMTDNHDFDGYTGGIRYRLPQDADRPVLAEFPIDLFADQTVAPAFADQIRGKYILIGGDITDIDYFLTPMTGINRSVGNNVWSGKTMTGLEVHASLLAQMLDGALMKPLPAIALWALSLLILVAAAFTSLAELRWWQLMLVLTVQAGLFGYLPFYLQGHGVDTLGLPAAGWAAGWIVAFSAIGAAARAVGAEQRKFAQSALGKYLPRDIASQILEEPEKLSLHGEKRPIFVVFTDLEGFTKLSHAIAPEMVANLLNRYLDMLSDVVLAHGGTIDKFVGDAVVAFWGAPIARPDDGEKAAQAAFAMCQAGEEFRKDIPEGVPPIGRTRVGLHYGEAIVGNFGGKGRIQYTALGDSMNTAARLESANKALKTCVLASREAVERSGLNWWRPMGKVVLRGRATPVEIFEARPDFSASDADHLQRIIAGLRQDRDAAKAELEEMIRRYPDDAALGNLMYRIEHIGDGDAYVLD